MSIPVIEIRNSNTTIIRRATKDDIAEIVYALIQLVPIGCVTTYSEIAKVLGITPRYVAKILKENRNPIAIPCHRVVKSNGELGGYTVNGSRADHLKRKILMIESLGGQPCRVGLEIFRVYEKN